MFIHEPINMNDEEYDEKFIKNDEDPQPPTPENQWQWAGKKRKLTIMESDISLRNCKKTRLD